MQKLHLAALALPAFSCSSSSPLLSPESTARTAAHSIMRPSRLHLPCLSHTLPGQQRLFFLTAYSKVPGTVRTTSNHIRIIYHIYIISYFSKNKNSNFPSLLRALHHASSFLLSSLLLLLLRLLPYKEHRRRRPPKARSNPQSGRWATSSSSRSCTCGRTGGGYC